jgi:hypothetical protein
MFFVFLDGLVFFVVVIVLVSGLVERRWCVEFVLARSVWCLEKPLVSAF